jgi:hypothetical protein
MGKSDLLEHEREVERSRARLSQDLAVLCSSDTLAAFTDDLKQEAFDTRDVVWEKLKARAASNPAAVAAIGAGLAWRLFRRPPIASALIGIGIYSLWKTQPKTAYNAAGQRLDYVEQSKEVLKEQAGQVFSAASDMLDKGQRAAARKGAEVLEDVSEKAKEWRSVADAAVSDTTARLKTSGEALLSDVQAKQHDLRDGIQAARAKAAERLQDDDSRDRLLLGVAGLAIAAALGIACQKRASEN